MTAVIVVAAIAAVVLLVAIFRLNRSRFADESERFKYVSDLTSKWSRENQTRRRQAAAAPEPAPIDLRDTDASEHRSSVDNRS